MPITVKDSVRGGFIAVVLVSRSTSSSSLRMKTQLITAFVALHVSKEKLSKSCIRGTVQALAAQLEELRVAVSSQHSTACLTIDSPSWSEVVRESTPNHRRRKEGNGEMGVHGSYNQITNQNSAGKSI